MARPTSNDALSSSDMNVPLPVTTVSPYAPGTQGNTTPSVLTPAAQTPAAPSYMDQILQQNKQWQTTLGETLPWYKERLGGFDSATAQAMRNKGTQQIQSQYGAGLRAAMNQAGAQGIRGPAAVAMQQDIRNQMGQATAGFERDLNIANWDAGRQALADYYGAASGLGQLDVGTLTALQQLQNAQTGSSNYYKGLQGMNSPSGGYGGGLPFQPLISSVTPSWLPLPGGR